MHTTMPRRLPYVGPLLMHRSRKIHDAHKITELLIITEAYNETVEHYGNNLA